MRIGIPDNMHGNWCNVLIMEILKTSVINKRILILTQSDGAGGAARAASRLHNCFLQSGMDVTMLVGSKSSKNESILKIPSFLKVLVATYSRFDFKLCRWLLPDSKQWKTSGMFGVVSTRALNKSSFDAINIHWIVMG